MTFNANLEIIGVNPFVFIPEPILEELFRQAGKNKGPIPIKCTVAGKLYLQTLVKFSGAWRLYINTSMLKNSPSRIGECIEIFVVYDPVKREIPPHPKFVKALDANKEAKTVFDALRPSLQHEIVRYLSRLKTAESLDRNIERAINFLLGKDRFIGRDKP